MKSNKLLEEAKRRYPIGTKFISPDNNKIYTVSLNESIENSYYLSMDETSCLVTINNWKRGQYLYYNDKWAEIIEEPNVNKNYKYLIKFLKSHGIQ